jgi:hypothetical protein
MSATGSRTTNCFHTIPGSILKLDGFNRHTGEQDGRLSSLTIKVSGIECSSETMLGRLLGVKSRRIVHVVKQAQAVVEPWSDIRVRIVGCADDVVRESSHRWPGCSWRCIVVNNSEVTAIHCQSPMLKRIGGLTADDTSRIIRQGRKRVYSTLTLGKDGLSRRIAPAPTAEFDGPQGIRAARILVRSTASLMLAAVHGAIGELDPIVWSGHTA